MLIEIFEVGTKGEIPGRQPHSRYRRDKAQTVDLVQYNVERNLHVLGSSANITTLCRFDA